MAPRVHRGIGRRLTTYGCLLVALNCGEAFAAEAGSQAAIQLLSSPEAQGQVQLDLARRALEWTAEQLKDGGEGARATRALPPVLLMHVTAEAAELAGTRHGASSRIQGRAGKFFYLIWFTHTPSSVEYALAALLILEDWYGVAETLGKERRVEITVRVARRLKQITPVDLKSLEAK